MDIIETGNAGPAEPDKARAPRRGKTKPKESVAGADAPHWTTQPPPPPPVALTAPPGTAKPTAAPKPKRLENPKAKANKAANEQLVVASLAAAAQGAVLAPEGAQSDRDNALFQQVGGRATVLMSRGPAGGLTRDEAMNMSTDDIAAIGAIQDQKTRTIALVAVAESRKAQPLYKAEFDRQAPSLAIEAEAAATLMAAPRSPEDERAYLLAMRRREASAQASMENTIELTPGRSQADDKLIAETVVFRTVAQKAEFCMTGPDGGVKSAMAKTLVAEHLGALGQITDPHLRNLTTDAIWEAAHAQQHYRTELAAQSPEVFAGYASLAHKAQFLASLKPAIDAQCAKPTDDAWRLRAIVANAKQMEAEARGAVSVADAMATVTADVAALRNIGNAEARRLALLVMERSKGAQEQYRIALTRQAPRIGVESHAAYVKQQQSAQQLQTPAPASTLAAIVPAPATVTPQPVVDRSTVVPDSVARRFTKVNNDYFLPSEMTPAFIDRGTKLATRGENRMVISSLVEIAKARGWDSITVGGTNEFRREAWLAASLVGIQVDGYKPTKLDKADLARWPPGNSIAQVTERMKAEPPTLTLVQPAEPVELAAPRLTKEQMADLLTKAASFANDKPSFVVKKYPDLAPAYGTLSAASMFAAEHLPGNEERFAKVAREALVAMIARGETVPAPDLSQGARKAPTQERGRSPAKGDELQRSR